MSPSAATVAAAARADLAQQQVAVVVAERVVDLLEAVEVDQQHGELPSRRARRARSLPSTALAEAARGWAGR